MSDFGFLPATAIGAGIAGLVAGVLVPDQGLPWIVSPPVIGLLASMLVFGVMVVARHTTATTGSA